MEVWILPRRFQAWYAHADFKKSFGVLELEKLRSGITGVTVERYPTVNDTLIGNLAYTTLYCPDAETRDLAEQTLCGYIAWKRASGAPVFNRERLGMGVLAVGLAAAGGVLFYRTRQTSDA